ncbi:VOC family protein [Neorhizobium sp. LjRoot104]|uniref:VOC family protein n=1 Tax=Neorhizobium sp. LjRoot104 TaxID=3342254 RepID=UPI003F508391
MPQSSHMVALIVRDYNEAIAFFVEKLGFDLLEDTHQPEQCRYAAVEQAIHLAM